MVFYANFCFNKYIKLNIFINVIGIIDSGSGGLNVIAECLKYYNEDFVYILDNKNCPYGNKKVSELKQILTSHLNFLTRNFDLDLIIVACNTLSSVLDFNDMLKYNLPILKTFPFVKNLKNNGKNVLVFATKNTIKNSKELKLIKINYPQLKTLYIKDLPKLIDNYLENKEVNEKNILINKLNYYFLDNYYKINCKFNVLCPNKYDVKSLKLSKKLNNIEYISLGCTHFKHIQSILKKMYKNKIKFLCCETPVAKNSKWLIRKNKQISTLHLILTLNNEKLENTIYDLFNQIK